MAKTTATKATTPTISNSGNLSAVFGKKNYMIMAVGVVFMIIGFVLMMGGRASDPAVFNAAELYSSTRITVAPILILIGLGINLFSILYKDK
jgi:hypothetical protein